MISLISGLGLPPEIGAAKGPAVAGSAFGKAMDMAVQAVDARQHGADAQLQGLASGSDMNLHGTMIALEEANIALHAMTSVRDKLVEAYQTLWNMPI
ncbi:MAG: flagellar hook-basal body complex protein FliE [Myxococcales bacterium]|nr:flagellar hook-basal body complex protein FliE [Myxococcales bacterium]